MPSTELRKTILTRVRRVVVKLGTQLLARKDAQRVDLDQSLLNHMATQMAVLIKQGYEITVVSSGAVGAGCSELGLTKRPSDVADLQAVAAVGQRRLMRMWHEAFEPHGYKVAQVLLTRSDFDERVRFLNIRNCVSRLHQMACIPIINENDTVAVDELRFGDNDQLAALMCNALRADALVLLTVVDGLLDGNGTRIDLVRDLDEVRSHVSATRSAMGSGGMSSKLEAARLANEAGEIAVVANGRAPNVLTQLLAGIPGVGTVFAPKARKLDSRQRWIGLTKRPLGTITIDDGAVKALSGGGKSLLPSGITKVTGNFEHGAVVSVCDPRGGEVARGLSNYASGELQLLQGKKTSQIEKTLGRPGFSEAIHRDNMVVLTGPGGASDPPS